MVDPTENLTSLDLLCALAGLTMNQREVFIDRYVLHRTERQIADTMGVTPSRVHHLARRARERMSGALSPLLVAA